MMVPNHLAEMLDSSISERLIGLNFRSIEDPEEVDRLLGRHATTRWQHSGHLVPGWMVCGVNPETGETSFRGAQYKPDVPPTIGGKPVKYLSPSGAATAPLFLDTGDPQDWPNTIADPAVPLWVTEGAKKAAAIMSRGHFAISIPGVWNGQKKGTLDPLLQLFATPGRVWYFAFDADQRQNAMVAKALLQLGSLLKATGGIVKICQWDEANKGIDDYLAGGHLIDDLVNNAIPLEEWRDATKEVRVTTTASLLQQAVKALYPTTSPVVAINGELYRWEGSHYEWVPPAVEKRRIAEFCDSFAVTKGDTAICPMADPKWVNKIYDWVCHRYAIDPRAVAPSGYINCVNGLLRLRWDGDALVREFLPHTPSVVFITKPAVRYDPSADTQYLNRVLDCLDLAPREVLLRTLACALDPDFFRGRIGRIRALLAYGSGSNGKDTLRAIAFRLFQGRTSCVGLSDFSQYDAGRKFGLAQLANSLLNWSSENTSALRLENIQSLKTAISGDPIVFEEKNRPAWMGTPKAIFIFNCNDLPKIIAQRQAEASRWAVIPFTKTFSAKPKEGELLLDPRFKSDVFIDEAVLPAFLNVLLERAELVAREGIDYDSVQGELDALQRQSSHLLQFAEDRGLSYVGGSSRVAVSEIWSELLDWYITNGYAEVSEHNGKKKITWLDDASGDRIVKADRFVVERFSAVFPKARRVVEPVTKKVFLEGLSFGGDPPVQQVELQANPQPEPPTQPPKAHPEIQQTEPLVSQQPEPKTTSRAEQHEIVEQPPDAARLQRGKLVYVPPYIDFLRPRSSVPRDAIKPHRRNDDWVPLGAITDRYHDYYGYAQVALHDAANDIVTVRIIESDKRIACRRVGLMDIRE